MRRIEAIKRVEELTYQVEALARENASLRVQLADTREQTDAVAEELAKSKEEIAKAVKKIAAMDAELKAKYVKVGNLLRDNGRLLNINAYLAEAAGHRPARRKIDAEGNWIAKEERK